MAEGVAGPVIGKVVDSVFAWAKKELGYMWNYKENVEKLKNKVESLKDMKGRVEQQIDIAKRDGNDLVVGVEKWVEDAAQQISKAQEFLEQEANAEKKTWCFKIGRCGNWAALHRNGKMIETMMTPCVLEHQERGKYFVTGVFVDTRAPGPLDVYQTKNLEGLVTHKIAVNDVIKALEDDNIQIIGIYGIGGVGKTTLAKEVVDRVKHLFADVAFTAISQTVKPQEIQKDIGNATKRIVKGERVLLILDDVWEKLDLEELGISIKHKNCKILLTSRSERVCQKMNAQSNICVNSLPEEEAWILFKHVVGERVETDVDLKPVAEEVAKECGGLPLLIQAVGSALKHESIDSWEAALSRLKKAAPTEIDADIEKAFTRLQLSYDYLKSEEAKSCFLLCSMYPEDIRIWLTDLAYYMAGLGKFDDLESIEDARYRVRNAVNMLKSSGLLLKVGTDEHVTQIHDVVRDVGMLIASKSDNKFLRETGKGLKNQWPPRNKSLESCKGISIIYSDIDKFPEYKVNLPHIEIFLAFYNWDLSMISDDFIGCLNNVKVMDLSNNNISSLPQSFKLLTKLRTLDLSRNINLHDISILGELRDLDILNLNETGIPEIPKEIGQLVNLRVLRVSKLDDIGHSVNWKVVQGREGVNAYIRLSRITPGVISKLQRLEELQIDLRWVSQGVDGCIAEIMKLSKLTCLHILVGDDVILPEGLNLKNRKNWD